MALASVFSDMDNNPWKMSLLFSALMEVVLAFLFLLSVCLSIISSTIIRFFHLRPPCFRTEPYGGAGWNTRLQENPRKLLCDYLAKILSLLQNIIFNRRLSPVHNLCEDCMLLNCTSTQENSSYVNSTPDTGHIDERYSSLYALFHVNNCRICSLKRQSSVLPCASDQERLEESPGLQFEAGNESGSSASFTRYNSTPRCCCCKEFIREMRSKDEFVKEKFAKVYVDDFEEQSWEQSNNKSSSSVTAPIPLCETEVFEQNFCKDYAEEKDKNQEAIILGDEPTLEHNASPSDCKKFLERINNDGELQPQIDHVYCKFSSNVLPEEEHDGEEQLLQNDSLDCKFRLITSSEEEQQDEEQTQNENLDRKLSSEMLMANRETLGSILPLTISESFLESVKIPLDDHARAAALPSVDPQSQNDQQKSEADEIKELKDALEAEREAYSAIYLELEEERNASAIAANETMAMISRLQEEKAAVQMESRQFKRMVEEKAAFDQEAIALLKDILCKREAEKFALEREVQLYRSRLFDHKIRKWRQQRWKSWKGEDHEEHNGKEKLQLPDWNEKRVLLLEGTKDEEIIKESQRLQGTFEDNRCSTSWDYDHAGTSRLIRRGSKMKRLEDPITRAESEKGSEFTKRIDELLLSSNGKILPDESVAVGTKLRQDDSWLTNGLNESEDENEYFQVNLQEASLAPEDSVCEQKLAVLPAIVENVCPTTRRSYAPEEKGRFIEEADKVGDASYFQLIPAHSWEMQKSMSTAAENVPNSSLGGLETLSSSFPNLNKHESACMGTSLENNIPYSQREDEEHVSSGRSSLESEDEFHLEPCKYIDELDDCITIEVGPTPVNSTEHLSSQQVPDVKAMPSSIERYEIRNELYEIPADLPAFKVSHKACPEELQPLERHSTNLAENATSVDRQARERESYDMKFSGNFAMFPGNGWQHGELKDSEQRNLFFKNNERLASTNEQTSDDGLDQDSLSSANEFIPDCLGYDPRTASMIKRDHQRTAVEEEVNQLTLRLQVLEDDRHIMKNLMETFRPENREMQFPDDIELQLQQLHGFDEKLENLKRVIVPEEPTALSKNAGKKRRR